MFSLNRFYIRFIWREDRKKCFSSSWTVLFHQMCSRKTMPGPTYIYWFLSAPHTPPAANGLSTTLATQKSFFDSFSKCNIQSPLRHLAEQHCIIDKDKKKNSLCVFPLLTHSLWIAHSIQPRGRRRGSALDWKEITHKTVSTVPFYFKV